MKTIADIIWYIFQDIIVVSVGFLVLVALVALFS